MKTFMPPKQIPVRSINSLMQADPAAAPKDGPSVEYQFDFKVQSRFVANADLGNITDPSYAILPGPRNPKSGIIQGNWNGNTYSTVDDTTFSHKQVNGYAVLWSADAELPANIVFYAGDGQKLTSQPLRMLPGMMLRPHGLPTLGEGKEVGAFSGFDIGVPFGWLGGGHGRLIVFKTADAVGEYLRNGVNEILIHQITLKVLAADDPANPANWPNRFPWVNAKSQLKLDGTYSTVVSPQGGPAQYSARCTRVVFEAQCETAGLAGATTVDVYVHRDGAAVPIYTTLTFPAVAAGNRSYVFSDDPIFTKAAGDNSFICIVNGGALSGLGINCYRYGTLG